MSDQHAPPDEGAADPGELRARIVAAAARLIATAGRDAVTTRAVAAAAGVQAPALYRLFGDKRGLLDAVAHHGLADYVAAKAARAPHPDPVEDLRESWHLHVAFGLAHPELFAILAGDPSPRPPTPAAAAGLEVLRRRVRAIARAGRLRVSEARAVTLLHAVGTGTVLTLIGQPEGERDAGLSAVALAAVLAAITTGDGPPATATARNPGPGAAAATLRASLDEVAVLTGGEKHLLEELLDRVADDG